VAVFHRRRGARLGRRPPGNWLALVQVLLCLVLFTACALHVRLRLRNAKNSSAATPAAPMP